jgi:hypothetical protein
MVPWDAAFHITNGDSSVGTAWVLNHTGLYCLTIFVDGLEIFDSPGDERAVEIIEAPTGHENWSGMVSVRTYAKQRMRDLQMHSGDANRALYQALPYAVKQASFSSVSRLHGVCYRLEAAMENSTESRVLYDPGLRQKLPKNLLILQVTSSNVTRSCLPHYLSSWASRLQPSAHSIGGYIRL